MEDVLEYSKRQARVAFWRLIVLTGKWAEYEAQSGETGSSHPSASELIRSF